MLNDDKDDVKLDSFNWKSGFYEAWPLSCVECPWMHQQ